MATKKVTADKPWKITKSTTLTALEIEEGGEGRADEYISKYVSHLKTAGGEA